MKVKCANGDEGILRQLVGTEVAVNVGGNAFVTKLEEVCGGLVQFRDVASKAVHDAVGEPDTDSSMSVVDDGEYAFEKWEEELRYLEHLEDEEVLSEKNKMAAIREMLVGHIKTHVDMNIGKKSWKNCWATPLLKSTRVEKQMV